MKARSFHSSRAFFGVVMVSLLATLALLPAAEKAKAPKVRAPAADKPAKPVIKPWADFAEPDAPFFSSVLDARDFATNGLPADNLTPRGLILNLGNGCWACFDTDLLRMSAIWQGQAVSAFSMSQISYQVPDGKVGDGQRKLPQIIGKPWMATGIYPGWQAGEKPVLTDPREPAPDPKEVGRGPIAPAFGQFKAVRLVRGGVVLEYEVAGAGVSEWVESSASAGRDRVQRRFRLEPSSKTRWLILGRQATGETPLALAVSDQTPAAPGATLVTLPDGTQAVKVNPARRPVEFSVAMGFAPTVTTWSRQAGTEPPPTRWHGSVSTRAVTSAARDTYVIDQIPVPSTNPWKRNVRLADIAFLKDGRAFAVTFDGDVWSVSGLGRDLSEVQWKRYATGFHEPLNLCVRNEELFVYDRNGIWRLRDSDGNGEADVHELFSNAFAQTAETREYANGFRPMPDGSFIIGKGGIQTATIGRHNGSVLRVSADGKTSTVIGHGLRDPFIGVHPKTGLITASDQQGHYVPSTPLHIIRDNQHYGFLSSLLPKEKYPEPIADPLVWIPHAVNASGVAQVWLTDAKMGPLNDALIHIGYYRPEIFLVLMNQRAPKPQAAVISLARVPEFAPLSGAVNPVDGQLYLIGFQIWGTQAKEISGLARVRYTGAPSTLPREVIAMDQGVLLRFDVPVTPQHATNPANFSVERWNYVRTAGYGSPHYKLDGTSGQEWMTPSSAYRSKDGKGVFVGIPGMKPVMQMRIGWALAMQAGGTFEQNAYFTPYGLPKFDPTAEGFEAVTVDLTPRTSQAAETPVTVAEGQRVAELMGCVACHSNDGSTLGKIGPTWKGLFGAERALADGTRQVANDAYIRESILQPTVKMVKGFEKIDAAMPSYEGVITDSQIQALILYLKTLK
jgi:cytochrome c2